jgi:DNA polymerase III alpha subunit (gram-positive type)
VVHPARLAPSPTQTPQLDRRRLSGGRGYVELHAHSAYSFLDGASLPEELAVRAAELGYDAFALTDHDGV